MVACDGLCEGYENDGVCNVPAPCPERTDCADCLTVNPVWSLVAAILSFLAAIAVMITICLQRRAGK